MAPIRGRPTRLNRYQLPSLRRIQAADKGRTGETIADSLTWSMAYKPI